MVRLWRKLGLGRERRAAPHPIQSRLRQRLEHLGAERVEYVAAFAGLLARVAYADATISAAEARAITSLVRAHGGLADREARLVAEIVRHQTEVLQGLENHLLTRAFNERASPAQKEALVDCLYAVATADDVVSNIEDQEIRRVGAALLLTHATIMKIRARYKDRLEVMRLVRR